MKINDQVIDTPPVASSSVVLLRDGPRRETLGPFSPGASCHLPQHSTLEVFMVRRHDQSSVLGGAWVFPGGKLDQADMPPLTKPDETVQAVKCRKALGEPALDLAVSLGLYRAAVRETREEATVKLKLDQLVPWVRWITPRVPTVMIRRFDTRFFLARLPAGQTALADEHEVTDGDWFHPDEALRAYADGQMSMAPAQIMSLVQLAWFSSATDALKKTQAQQPPTVQPESTEQDGTRHLLYPGDPAHSVAKRALKGPSRLVVTPQGMFEPLDGWDGFWRD